MNSIEQLLCQWEPRIRKLSSITNIYGMDFDDICQELRLTLLHSIKHFDNSRGVLFYTYLDKAFRRKISDLIKESKRKNISNLISLDNAFILNRYSAYGFSIDFELEDYIRGACLSPIAELILRQRIWGNGVIDITEFKKKNPYLWKKANNELKEKFNWLKQVIF